MLRAIEAAACKEHRPCSLPTCPIVPSSIPVDVSQFPIDLRKYRSIPYEPKRILDIYVFLSTSSTTSTIVTE